VAIEERRFEEGRLLCEKALKDDPKFFPARFNLCEIPFVQGKYAGARHMFQKLLDEYPKNDLLKFRVFLTYLLEKNETAAGEHLDRLPFLSNTPVYYYAQAAWAFAHGKPDEARTCGSRQLRFRRHAIKTSSTSLRYRLAATTERAAGGIVCRISSRRDRKRLAGGSNLPDTPPKERVRPKGRRRRLALCRG
jgi:tetratricopeptide (TPR) repeat protein